MMTKKERSEYEASMIKEMIVSRERLFMLKSPLQCSKIQKTQGLKSLVSMSMNGGSQ